MTSSSGVPRPAGLLVLVSDDVRPIAGSAGGPFTRVVAARISSSSVVRIGDDNHHVADVRYRIDRLELDVPAFLGTLTATARASLRALSDEPDDSGRIRSFQRSLRPQPPEGGSARCEMRTAAGAELDVHRCEVVVVGDHNHTHSTERVDLGAGRADLHEMFAQSADLVRDLGWAVRAHRESMALPDDPAVATRAAEACAHLDARLTDSVRGGDVTDVIDPGSLDCSRSWLTVWRSRASAYAVPHASVGRGNETEVRWTATAHSLGGLDDEHFPAAVERLRLGQAASVPGAAARGSRQRTGGLTTPRTERTYEAPTAAPRFNRVPGL